MFGQTQFPVRQGDRYTYIDLRTARKGPTLVLLHGMFGRLSNFDPLVSQLGEYPVFVPEIPIYAFGKRKVTIPELANWLHGVLDAHGIERPVLVGNSMGGHIALQYALTRPERVAAMVLTGSSGLFENDLGTSRPKRRDRDYVRERASQTFYRDIVDENLVDDIMHVLQTPKKLSRLLCVARSTHKHNLEHQLSGITHPVQLIWGRHDTITPPEVAEQFRALLPNARLSWIEECGHAPMMEAPNRFSNLLINFLKELTTTD